MFPFAVVAGAVALLFIFSQSASAQTPPIVDDTGDLPPTPGVAGSRNVFGAIIAGAGAATKLAGQGTQGGTPAKSPNTAIRAAGAVAAATGVVQYLQARSNVGRTLSGAQVGVGTATAVGAALGPATLGISAGVGALVGFVAGINANDTKQARWDFAAGNGYTRDGNGFDRMIRVDLAKVVGTQLSEALWVEAVSRIGRKDRAWNEHWLDRVVRAFAGQQVHAYTSDPTKGANPVL